MVVIAVPAALGSTREEALALRDALLFEDGIEIPVTARDGRLWVRLAIQIDPLIQWRLTTAAGALLAEQ